MANGIEHRIASNEESFRLYVVETLGGLKADVTTIKTQNEDQYNQIHRIDQNGCAVGCKPDRGSMIKVGGFSAGIAAVLTALGDWALRRMGGGQ